MPEWQYLLALEGHLLQDAEVVEDLDATSVRRTRIVNWSSVRLADEASEEHVETRPKQTGLRAATRE